MFLDAGGATGDGQEFDREGTGTAHRLAVDQSGGLGSVG